MKLPNNHINLTVNYIAQTQCMNRCLILRRLKSKQLHVDRNMYLWRTETLDVQDIHKRSYV